MQLLMNKAILFNGPSYIDQIIFDTFQKGHFRFVKK